MIHLKQIMPKKKRITTTIGIASVVAVAAIAAATIIMKGYYPVMQQTLINAFSTVSDGLSNTFAVASEDAKTAIVYIQNQIERQLM